MGSNFLKNLLSPLKHKCKDKRNHMHLWSRMKFFRFLRWLQLVTKPFWINFVCDSLSSLVCSGSLVVEWQLVGQLVKATVRLDCRREVRLSSSLILALRSPCLDYLLSCQSPTPLPNTEGRRRKSLHFFSREKGRSEWNVLHYVISSWKLWHDSYKFYV